MSSDYTRRPSFSEREGLVALPPQLAVGKLSELTRRLLWHAVFKDFQSSIGIGAMHSFLDEPWRTIALELHVRLYGGMPDHWRPDIERIQNQLKSTIMNAEYNLVFDMLECALSLGSCTRGMRSDILKAFVDGSSAYRLFDGNRIGAVGSDEHASAILRALHEAEAKNCNGARQHLLLASYALRDQDWAGSVRESIHAVESVAVQISLKKQTLDDALTVLEKRGYLHAGLKRAFSNLYGYTSNESGIRHALVFSDQAKVDETDALFMLGACASFVSYLLARAQSITVPAPAAESD